MKLPSTLCFLLLVASFKPALAQNGTVQNQQATDVALQMPSGLAIDSKGNLFIAERGGHRIRKVDLSTGSIYTIAGTGTSGFGGDGGQADKAQIANPELITVDDQDNIIITDRSNARIRKINSQTGIITTLTGNGQLGYTGDGQLARDATISNPFGVLIGPNNDIFIADTENHVIRKIDSRTGIISTVAGNGEKGFSGDGASARDANLNRPHNFIFDRNGNMIIGDSMNLRIRLLNMATGKIQTLYGIGEVGLSEDGTDAKDAKFGFFGNFVLDGDNLIFTEWINNRIRVIDMNTGIMTSIRDSTGQTLEVSGPYGIAKYQNSLYVAEASANRVIKFDLQTRTKKVVAGK